MNTYKIVKIEPHQDAYADYPYKQCYTCHEDLLTDIPYYDALKYLDGFTKGYNKEGHFCSEVCLNTYILQHMDDKKVNFTWINDQLVVEAV